MEQEIFVSGYCRSQDGPRTVWAVIEGGECSECDCAYPDCLYASSCPIAAELGQSAAR